jgi:hypothetical protein
MNRSQKRSVERSNLKAKKSKVVRFDEKTKKLSQIKEKTLKNSIIISVVVGIVLATFFILNK